VKNGTAEIWHHIEEDIVEKAREKGAAQVLGWLESTLSQVLRIGPRQVMEVRNFPTSLDELYQGHKVIPEDLLSLCGDLPAPS
jgi:hypothetical protein